MFTLISLRWLVIAGIVAVIGTSMMLAGEGVSIVHGATMTVTKTADTDDGVCDEDCSLSGPIAK